MRKILVTAIHPAPYIDLWLEALNVYYSVDALYLHDVTPEKGWKNYQNDNVKLYAQYSFLSKLKLMTEYDLVILSGWNTMEHIFLSISLLFFETKVAFFCDHPIVGQTKSSHFYNAIKRLIFGSADFILPASMSCKLYLEKTYGIKKKKMHVFPYAHSTPQTDILKVNRQRQEQLRDGKKIKLLIANRFVERKGYKIVLNAFKILQKDNLLNQFDITVVGDGEQFVCYKDLFTRLYHGINFLGWVENEDYENYMDNCDVFLHASLFEPFGIPPLDAMQRGKTIIVSDGVKSVDFIAENCKTSGIYVYSSDNSSQLVEILKTIVKDRDRLYDNSEKIITVANENYSAHINIEAVQKIIL